MRQRLLLTNVLVLLCGTTLFGQYRFPIDMSTTDSISVQQDLKNFAAHAGVHVGDIPGFVFQQDREFPRIQFYYEQGTAYSFTESRYAENPENGFTSLGMFTGIGDLTSNLQLILRYNPILLENHALVLNGYGARYRSGVGTDSLHALALGVLVQKIAGDEPFFTKHLDFSVQYGLFLRPWIFRADIVASYINGRLDLSNATALDPGYDGTFKERVIHGSTALYYQWQRMTTGVTLRTTGKIWNIQGTIGWSLPSNF